MLYCYTVINTVMLLYMAYWHTENKLFFLLDTAYRKHL